MEQYKITGMSCSACSSRVEHAVSSVNGVVSCNVSLLTNSMSVEGSASREEIFKAVADAGYGISSLDKKTEDASFENELKDTETPRLLVRFLVSLTFLILLMYFSMGHNMLNFPVPPFLDGNYFALGLIQLLLSAIIMVINQRFFINGAKGLFKGAPNMDTLVSIGSLASFVYSTVMLFMVSDATILGTEESLKLAHSYYMDMYFESAGMILALITLGKTLESYSKGKTTSALKDLIMLTPQRASVLRDGVEIEIPASEVILGDIFIVKSGAKVPVDGVIIEGDGSFEESSLTGESVPRDKEVGGEIYASSTLVSGYIKARATKIGEDTALGKIIKTVKEATATKAPVAKIADRVSGIFVPVVLLLATITTAVWMVLGAFDLISADILGGHGFVGFALARGISVLVISCPCSLGLATPVAIMVGSGVGAKRGILFKSAEALENCGKCKTVAFDKTGTLTKGEPRVNDVFAFEPYSKEELLSLAFSLESFSEHPLAKAICTYCEENNVEKRQADDFEPLFGSGVLAKIDGALVLGGSYKQFCERVQATSEQKSLFEGLANEGKTPLFFIKNDTPLGVISVSDTIRDESYEAIDELSKMNIKTVMITGDNKKTADKIASELKIDEVISEVMPQEKKNTISLLKGDGRVCMVGDGVNDSPALAEADIGIAIGAGTDVAIDTSDIVLTKSSPRDVVTAIKLSKKTLSKIKGNLFWALIYNSLGIPVAMGVFSFLGFTLSPMLGALFMSLSSFSVVTNALTLYLFKDERQNSATLQDKEELELTIKVTGMMCEHCEKRVTDSLLSLDEVISANASFKRKQVKIALKSKVDLALLESKIEEAGYKVKR